MFGEVLCDLFAHRVGEPLATTGAFVPLQGGAPANVAVQLARLGVATTLVTAVGNDPLGARLTASLLADGVDTTCIAVRRERRTGVTLVEVDADGERRFFGFRENSADLSLGRDDVESAVVQRAVARAAIVHTGTVSLRSASARQATTTLQKAARKSGALVSLDVNLRPGMFPSLEALLRLARRAVARVDVVKATRQEAELVLDLQPPRGRTERALRAHDDALVDGLLSCGPRLALLTLDEAGAVVATRSARARGAAPRGDVVDATGAGDGFVGAVLAELAAAGLERAALDDLDDAALQGLGVVGCRAGSAVVTAVGATTAMVRGPVAGVLTSSSTGRRRS